MMSCKPTGELLYHDGQTYLFVHDGSLEQRREAILGLRRWEQIGLISSDADYMLLGRLSTVSPADIVRQEVRRG